MVDDTGRVDGIDSQDGASEEYIGEWIETRKIRDQVVVSHFLCLMTHWRRKMPNKTDQVVFCPLGAQQLSIYKRILEMKEVKLITQKDDPCDCGSRKL